jgi:hypothetical protein
MYPLVDGGAKMGAGGKGKQSMVASIRWMVAFDGNSGNGNGNGNGKGYSENSTVFV